MGGLILPDVTPPHVTFSYVPLLPRVGLDPCSPIGYGVPHVLKREVEESDDYAVYRPALREDFRFSCAYCTISERDYGEASNFQIDHYFPQTSREELRCDYRNLMYACRSCNAAKSDVNPPPLAVSKDFRFVKVDEEDPICHYKLDGERVKAITHAGELTVETMALNSYKLMRIRQARAEICDSVDGILCGLQVFMDYKNIDRLPPRARAQYLKIRSEVEAIIKQQIEGFMPELLLALPPRCDQTPPNASRRLLKDIKDVYGGDWHAPSRKR